MAGTGRSTCKCFVMFCANVSPSFLCRLRAASVLLVGVRGLGAEIAKNIVLAGIKSLTLLDPTLVSTP